MAGFPCSDGCLLKLFSVPSPLKLPRHHLVHQHLTFDHPLTQRSRQKKTQYQPYSMARAKNRRPRRNAISIAPEDSNSPPPREHDTPSPPEHVTPPLPVETFPFMSLPPEIRLMVYDAAMPKEIQLCGVRAWRGLPATIQALMNVKTIREELIPHLYGRCNFQWVDINRRAPASLLNRYSWDCFRRQALPSINSLIFCCTDPTSYSRPVSSFRRLDSFLRWARWRSLRAHLYPWHLKKLTLVKSYSNFLGRYNSRWEPDLEHGVNRFLIKAPIVAGLDSFRMVLNSRPSEEAARAFLERCESSAIDGSIGYCQYGRGIVSEWFRLRDKQVVCETTNDSQLENAALPDKKDLYAVSGIATIFAQIQRALRG